MRAKLASAVAVTAAVLAVTWAGSSPAGATDQLFVGYAGASLVRAQNNTVTSDLTAASQINNMGLVSDSDTTAHVTVKSLLTTGTVTTSTRSRAISGGYEVVSHSRTTGARLLNGAITVSAIDTTTTSRVVDGQTSSDSTTRLVGIDIPGVNLPVNIPPNYQVSIPGVATVILNYELSSASGRNVMTIGMGLYIGLLKSFGSNEPGAAVAVNLTYAALGPAQIPPSGHVTQGRAYGTQVTANVGSLAGVRSDPTAPISLAAGGTKGATRTSSVAGVNITSLARVGAVTDSVKGTNVPTLWEAQTASRVAAVNLFNGIIRADAVTANAHVRGTASGTAVSGSSRLVNLVIAGKAIPLNARPNTVLKLGIGRVTINQQLKSAKSVTVRALDIVLGRAAYGLPAGAEVQIAVANASVS
jgi:hypothetical protein